MDLDPGIQVDQVDPVNLGPSSKWTGWTRHTGVTRWTRTPGFQVDQVDPVNLVNLGPGSKWNKLTSRTKVAKWRSELQNAKTIEIVEALQELDEVLRGVSSWSLG